MLEGVTKLTTRPDSEQALSRYPTISFVLIVYDMAIQAENTIRSLLPGYQHGVKSHEYEVIIVENESSNLLPEEFLQSLPANFRYFLCTDAEPSPGAAVNFGAGKTTGNNICVLIDGARLLTPGVVKNIILGHKISDSAVISIPGYHLGEELQQDAVEAGYDCESERHLLDSINWPEDGYRLFEISCLSGSSGLGFFLPSSESNCISIARGMWDELDGYDTRFNLRGGGLINLDFYKRACEHDNAKHVILPGEGTFHQFHRGVTTGGLDSVARSEYIEASNQQYMQLKGSDYESPCTAPIVLGEVPAKVQKFILYSAQMAIELEGKECLGKPY